MILQIESSWDRIKIPFKFNFVWLGENDFGNIVRGHWNYFREEEISSPMLLLVEKLKNLKSIVPKWEKNCKRALKNELCQIEENLDKIYAQNICGLFTMK